MALNWDWVMKMKEIRSKITVPFLITIVIIPLVTLVLFNIAMKIYFAKTDVQDLKNTVTAVEGLIKSQIGEDLLNSSLNNSSRAITNLVDLRSALRTSKLTANTEFILFNKNREVIFPKIFKPEDTFVTDNLISEIDSILPSIQKGKVYTITEERDRFIAVGNKMSSLPSSPYIVFVSKMDSGNEITGSLNIMLILILLFALIISGTIAFGVSKSISRPIITLCGYARKIGKGEFVDVPPDTSSREIYELCRNMNEMSRQLENSNNAQKTFLQNASHELRTPLMSIQGYAEGIMKGVFPDTDRAAQIICDESKRLNTLVEELLTLSYIENKTYKSEMAALNLSHMVREYIQRVNGLAIKENKNIISIIGEKDVLIYADDNLLSRAVINVISNCIRYARFNVQVSVYEKDRRAFIRIEDDGNGINEEDLPHIFERFFKGKNGNFGLGLSIAKVAAEYMGGTISAHNTGKGAEFVLSFPVL